jgi:transcriptional regulator GlxA family with amidase domain
MHHVAVLALDGVVAFDLSIPTQVFGHRDERERYRMVIAGERPGPVTATAGFGIVATHGLGALRRADTIVVPGVWPTDGPFPPAVLAAIRAADRRGARRM